MRKIAIGRIINTHGLKGEVKVESWSDFDEERYEPGNTLYLDNGEELVEVVVETYREHKGYPLVSFKDKRDINLVEQYKGYEIVMDYDDRKPLPEGRYYVDELIGLTCVDEEGNTIGEVLSVEPTNGAQNNLRVEKEDGKQVLIPYVPFYIVEVNKDEGIIVVHVIEGLL